MDGSAENFVCDLLPPEKFLVDGSAANFGMVNFSLPKLSSWLPLL